MYGVIKVSRSYKHIPGFTQGEEGTKSFFKKDANKLVRKSQELDNGSMYKRLYCSYNICDYKWLLFNTEDELPPHMRTYKIWIK